MGVKSKTSMIVDDHRLMDDHVLEEQVGAGSRVVCLFCDAVQQLLPFPSPFVVKSQDLGYWTYQEIDTSSDDLLVARECHEYRKHRETRKIVGGL
jgi:hypothetical protein